MNKYHLEAKASLGKIDFSVKQLPKKLGIVSTIQYLGEMKKIVDYLWKKEIKAVIAGQVLGCNAGAAMICKDDVDAFLYVGSGEFHPIGVATRTGKPVFVLNPVSMNIKKIDENQIAEIRKRKKAMLTKFHVAETIGVLMTTKNGQSSVQGGLKKVKDIEKKYPNKKFYRFVCGTLDFSDLENFPFIDCWLNTMCPRIMEDINVLNVEDLE
ncbi:diphthamide synthesis protein [Candidatus Woesearchaeota archaeon]|nr:diphthamide synthesis protein [Candidatus Woesearchaeota archaeon]